MAALQAAGVRFDPIDVPETREREDYFPAVLPACLIATLGRERFQQGKPLMDPVIAKRGESGLEVRAADYLALVS